MISKDRHSRWIKLVALGLPLYLSSCATAEPPTMSALPPLNQTAGASGSNGRDVDIIRIGDRMRANGDPRNAAAMYQQAHLANPNSAVPLVKLGETLIEIGAATEAAQAYANALEIEPKNADALRGLGLARVLLQQPEFAIAQFEAALAVSDSDARAYNGLGVALDMLGQHEAAQEAYRKALDIAPNNAKVLNNLGLSMTLTGNSGEAIAILERVNKSPSATAQTRQNLALAYGVSGNLGAAERVAQIDLPAAAVKRNLAFYAAHQGTENIDALARSLGVQREDYRTVANRESATDGTPGSQAPKPADPQPTPSSAALAEPAGADEKAVPAPGIAAGQLPAAGAAEQEKAEPVQPAVAAPATADPVPLLQPTETGDPKVTSTESKIAGKPPASPRPASAEQSVADPLAAMAASGGTAAPPEQPAVASAGKDHETALQVMSLPDIDKSASMPRYRVQLGAYRSHEAATRSWGGLSAAQPDLLGQLEPVISRVDLGATKGIFFRLQAGGFPDSAGANALCRDLKARNLDCVVVKASPAEVAAGLTGASADRSSEPQVIRRT